MTAQSGDTADDRPTPWALDHPGVAAVVSSVVAVVGVALVVGWLLAQHPGGPQPDLLGALRDGAPLVVGALMFLVGLPAALGFSGASCLTGRELAGGVAGGFVSVVLSIAVVVVVLPVDGLAL